MLSLAASLLTISLVITIVTTPNEQHKSKKVKIVARDDIPWGTLLSTTTATDPAPTNTSCAQFNYNVILLLDRSIQFISKFTPAQYAEYQLGIKHYLDTLAAMGTARGGHVRVILSAYGTYNVWQNVPQNQVRDQAWTDSIDISAVDGATNTFKNLQTLKDTVDEVFAPNDPLMVNSYDPSRPSTAYKGYTAAELARANDSQYKMDNLDDALIQATREVSRWSNGAVTADPNNDIDLVLVLTGGQPSVNNGINHFANQSTITTNPPWPYNTLFGSWYVANQTSDVFRAQADVYRLRSGAALNGYIDPNAGNAKKQRESIPAFDGARQPVRVFAQLVNPNLSYGNVAYNQYLDMIRIFGNEYQDYYTANPASGGYHRHWDKTVGGLDNLDVTTDLGAATADASCIPAVKPTATTGLEVSVPAGQGVMEGTTTSVPISIKNTSNVPFRIESISVGATSVPNVVTETLPTDCYTYTNVCTVRKNNTYGTKFASGTGTPISIPNDPSTNKPKTLLMPGETLANLYYTTSVAIGAASTSPQIQVFGRAVFDKYSQIAPANNGYLAATASVAITVNRIAMPA